MKLLSVIIVLALSLVSCTDSGFEAIETSQGEAVRVWLKEGSKLLLTPEDAILKFTEVASDSRCPEDVVCVWAGIAEIVLKLEESEESAESYTLTITGKHPYRASTIEWGSYRVTLMQLNPYPKWEDRNLPRVYEALLEIEKIQSH